MADQVRDERGRRHGVNRAVGPAPAGLVLGLVLSALGPPAAADSCAGSTWDLSREQAVFATDAAAVVAATVPAASASGPAPAASAAAQQRIPALETDRLYDIALAPQAGVTYVMAPAKKALTDGAYGGFVRLHIPAAGQYRVSLDAPFWIDVIAGGTFAPTTDFTGMRGCPGPHKIVQYPLPAGDDLVLQFSGGASPHVRVAVTAAPVSGAAHAPGTAPGPMLAPGRAPAKSP